MRTFLVVILALFGAFFGLLMFLPAEDGQDMMFARVLGGWMAALIFSIAFAVYKKYDVKKYFGIASALVGIIFIFALFDPENKSTYSSDGYLIILDFALPSLVMFFVAYGFFKRFNYIHISGVELAGQVRRILAFCIDALIYLIPIILLENYLIEDTNTLYPLFYSISNIPFLIINVLLLSRYGATVGKMIVGIIVVKDNLEQINLTVSLRRNIVEVLYSLIWAITAYQIFQNLDLNTLKELGFLGKFKVIEKHESTFHKVITYLEMIWLSSELIVMLLNKNKKALHDYIGGTLVLHKPSYENIMSTQSKE